MSKTTLGAYSHKIRDIFDKHPEKVVIDVEHIEKERRYREITASDVNKVLKIGRVVEAREETNTLVVEGMALDGRKIRLFCSLLDEGGDETLVIADAECVNVATAFEPGISDDELKNEWLAANPEFEDAGKKGVQRKTLVTKTE